jgi:hypothetical protein
VISVGGWWLPAWGGVSDVNERLNKRRVAGDAYHLPHGLSRDCDYFLFLIVA